MDAFSTFATSGNHLRRTVVPVDDDTGGTHPTDLFLGIDDSAMERIKALGGSLRLDTGVDLFREGDPAKRCFYVISGRMKLTKLHDSGREVIVRYVGPHETAAAVAAFRQSKYPVTATAVENTELIGWEKNGWIRSGRERIVVTDPHSLVTFAEFGE